MRVVVASDAMAGMSAAGTSEEIAHAFARRGADVAVVPLAVGGEEFRDCVASCAPEAGFVTATGVPDLVEALGSQEPSIIVDLREVCVDDLGRELLAAFDPRPASALERLRAAWAGRELVALVPEEQILRELTGLSGHASTQLREEGAELGEVLRVDAEAQRWAGELEVSPAPGAGAARGLGLIVQALGGTLTDPLGLLVRRFGLAETMSRADLVVTGAASLDFHALGGPVVKRVAAMATEALRPLIAVVGRNFVSARELRQAGFESAYPLVPAGGDLEPDVARLREVAEKVAVTWHW